jgi:RecB family exonuclease
VERERVASLLARHLRHARQIDDMAWRPAHLEVAFGRTPGKSNDALSRNDFFELNCAVGPVRFSGQIDRIDVCPTGSRIVDYKTSVNMSKTAVRNGESMQLPIYALALDAMLLPDRPCAEAVLIRIGTKDCYPAFEAGANWTELAANVRKRVSEIVLNIRAGYFPPTPKKEGCFVCKQRRACRYERARIERKAEGG